jgi:type IV pilus assembly protein PilQ
LKLKAYIFALALAIVVFCLSGNTQPLDVNTRVSLNFDDTPISAVLKMLAAQNDINLVVSSAVEGNVSISLENVTLEAALDAMLLPNGYNYYISNNIIIVKDAGQQMVGELTVRTYRLIHISAHAAQLAVEPLLSDKGKAIILRNSQEQSPAVETEHSSELVIYDYPVIHSVVARLLPQIDRRKRQVSVEVKIIETDLSKDEELGINWPKSIEASIHGVDIPGTSSDDINPGASAAAVMPLEDGNWQLGYLTIHQVDLVIDFLEQRGSSKLLSNPRVTTMDGEPASIQIQKVIPIQTINRFSEGAIIQDIVTYQDLEVGISLRVTPHISDDSTITMEVKPVVEEIIGYTGHPNDLRPITSMRSVNTTVTVKNNETVALGGLLKESQIENEEKVFLLGSIPILGGLFTHKKTENRTTDLLILITPIIID